MSERDGFHEVYVVVWTSSLKAIQVSLGSRWSRDNERKWCRKKPRQWIPDSAIHADSEVFVGSTMSEGKLILARWKAEELGWVQREARRPLPTKKHRRDEAVLLKAAVERLRKRATEVEDAGDDFDSICECGTEGCPGERGGAIAFHVTCALRNEADVLQSILDKV